MKLGQALQTVHSPDSGTKENHTSLSADPRFLSTDTHYRIGGLGPKQGCSANGNSAPHFVHSKGTSSAALTERDVIFKCQQGKTMDNRILCYPTNHIKVIL